MGIISPGEIYTVSTIITCCGINFCMMAADKRKSFQSGDESIVLDDNTEKIFRVNNNILFGGSGVFWGNEKIYEPIKDRMNDRLTIVDAVKMTEDYMYNNLAFVRALKRYYFISGRDDDGIYYLVRVCLREKDKCVHTDSFVPMRKDQKAYMIALPKSMESDENATRFNQMLDKAVGGAESLPDLYLESAKIIRTVEKEDTSKSVDGGISFLSIHD